MKSANIHCAFNTQLYPMERFLLVTMLFFGSQDGEFNRSKTFLHHRTGFSVQQITNMITKLEASGHIVRRGDSYFIKSSFGTDRTSIPLNWWPASQTIQNLTDSYPNHHFEIKEAVNDFIDFCNSRGIKIPVDAIDLAFERNIAAILDRRPTGPVKIADRNRREEPAGVGAFLSGMH